MPSYENTNLWIKTLAARPEGERDLDAVPRELLRTAFGGFRERAQVLAAEIPRDLPDFTVHDISHIDALWEMADLVAGPDYRLTPTEAFVLGGAFLIHDLGMGLAAYPEGIEALRREPEWRDTLASAWQSEIGRFPNPAELDEPPRTVEGSAIEQMLRVLHARRAERLALTSWRTEGGETYHLIDNPELRREFGPTIGRIAHSHWWAVDKLREEFRTPLGAPSGFPRDWTVDPLKLACLLRIADASHIDARRAPGFLQALRQPQGIAKEHWVFQEHLYQPQLSEDRLRYTSGHHFTFAEASAWWLCFDALQLVDRELRQVDALLADTGLPRLAARSVAGIENPERLTPLVPTVGWAPVDARIKVGNVAELVKRLGGEELYGQDSTVPLRELIQNGRDAVRARRTLEDRLETWGEVVVRLGTDSNGYWVEVEDTGIGMSAEAVTGALLDFGHSYWGSDLMRRESPGLLASGFRPTGKYGIGFFSVFMWGERVRVATRRPEVAQRETLVLEFETGLESRPVLREASAEEVLRDGGTRVRVWIRGTPYEERGLLRRSRESEWSLKTLCGWLCPSLDVNLIVEDQNGRNMVVAANDWEICDGEQLLYRVLGAEEDTEFDTEPTLSELSANLRLLSTAEGTVVGRACIILPRNSMYNIRRADGPYREEGAVTVGGLRADYVGGIGGILVGRPMRAARDVAVPLVAAPEVACWASEQADLLTDLSLRAELQVDLAEMVRAVGGDTKGLFVVRSASGWLTRTEIASWTESLDEVLLLGDIYDDIEGSNRLNLNSDVLVVATGMPGIWGAPDVEEEWPRGETASDESTSDGSIRGLVLEALAEAWGTSVAEIIKASDLEGSEERAWREVGVRNNRVVALRVTVIKNPKPRY